MPVSGTLALDLFLLGFKPTLAGSLVAGTLVFDKPSARLLEDVLYFLLLVTRSVECSERLVYCYPATSALQSKQFRAEALKLYEELRKNGELSRDIILRKSMIEEGVGERLEEGLERWAQFLLARRGCQSTPPPATITGPCYALEMHFPGSSHNQLTRIREQIKTVQEILHQMD
jgi:hypothetical protein